MIDNNCIFCKIASERKALHLYNDGQVAAFRDINPQSPVHILIIPIDHYDSIKSVTDELLIGRMLTAAKKVAEDLGVVDYRLVMNTGHQAGQSVFHVHLHLLAGRTMHWPPG